MIRVGSTVGSYTVISKLGEGAMAAVYLAEHPRIGKRVAIKVIHPELSTSQEMVSRFFTEARAASQIHHDSIVNIQDFGQTPDGDNFIIMEFLEGDTLAERLRTEGRFDTGRATAIALNLCEGLGVAHQGGVIHRDLKPDNIFLVRRGSNPDFPKILDFGLAKITGTPAQAGANHKTRTGSVLGTPHYMAPEQCEGKTSVDGRADIYSLGCILFQMLTGELPFPGEGFGEVLVKHLREPPPSPRQKNPQISPALEKIVLHCLAKKREWRFQNILDLARALRDPERFSAEIGDDLRRIVGPMPGEPDPPQSAPAQPVLTATPMMETIVGGAGVPLPAAPVVQSGATAAPEQRTMIAMAQPVMPPPAGVPAAPPPPISQFETVVGGNVPPIVQARSGRTVAVDLGAPQARDMPTVVPGTMRPPLPAGGPARPFHKSPAFLGLVVGLSLALLGLVLVPLLRPRIYTITINSTPLGAQVIMGGAVLGQTPYVLQVKRGDPDVKLTLHKDGFVDALRQVQAKGDQTLSVRLLPKPKAESPEGEGTEQAPEKPAAKPERPVAQPEKPAAPPSPTVDRATPSAAPPAVRAPTAAAPPPGDKPKRPRRPKPNVLVPF